jgi:hypothetical protein
LARGDIETDGIGYARDSVVVHRLQQFRLDPRDEAGSFEG